jgi:ABC-2 type transport system permease protein
VAGAKYAAVYACAVRDQLRYLASFAARNLFFVVVLFIFTALWRAVFAGRALVAGLSMVQTLWYLTFTETVELCKSRVHLEVQDEVRDGSIAYRLVRPCSYVLARTAGAMGEATARTLPILAVGFVAAGVLVGPLPGYLRALPFGLVLIAGGLLLNTLWLLVFGLLAFWVEEVSPFYWIYQKLVFVIGGMFFPIDFFPGWLRGIAAALPFAYAAYWPARIMVRFDFREFLAAAAGQAAYVAAMLAAASALFALARRRVHAHGG